MFFFEFYRFIDRKSDISLNCLNSSHASCFEICLEINQSIINNLGRVVGTISLHRKRNLNHRSKIKNRIGKNIVIAKAFRDWNDLVRDVVAAYSSVMIV